MLVPKSIAITFLASSVNVGAFTAPTTSLGIHRGVVSSYTSPAQHQPAVVYNSFDPSLKFWKNDNVPQTTSTSAIDNYDDITFEKEEAEVPASTLGFIGFSLLGFTFVMQRLQIYLNTPCLNGSQVCTVEYKSFAQYFADHDVLSFMMILTHSIPFVLLPWVSKQISEVGPIIKRDFEDFNPFLSMFFSSDIHDCTFHL